jgi:hypothetical protein
MYLTLPRPRCKLDETTELRDSVSQKVPNVNCELITISSDKKDVILKLELFAYKEKLLKKELCLERSDHNFMLTLVVLARVLGKCNQELKVLML